MATSLDSTCVVRNNLLSVRLIWLSILGQLISGCTGDDLSRALFFTALEIHTAETKAPLASIQIWVAAIPRTPFVEPSQLFISLTPTGTNGQTLVPIVVGPSGLFNGDTYPGDLEIRVLLDSGERIFVVSNVDGSCTADEDVELCVISTHADAPQLPDIEGVLGSNPARVSIDGYIGGLWICDMESRRFLSQIRSRDSFPFVSEIVVGEIPSGFVDDDTGIRDCSWMLADFTSISGNRVAFVFVPGLEEPLPFGYCVSSDETVVECGN